MDVSVIIVNYNTRRMTADCLDSLFAQTSGLDFEVIVVDNASTDDSREHFSADPRITYLYSDVNLGFGKANNLGFERARGRYIFLLNSDTLLRNNAIGQMYDFMQQAPSDVGACGGLLLNAEGQVIHSYGDFRYMWDSFVDYVLMPIFWKFHYYYQSDRLDNPKRRRPQCFDVDYITGADLFMRREMCDALGLFDPEFFLYYEETEMQYRYARAGWRRVIIEGPQIVHLEGQSSSSKPQLKKQAVVMRSLFVYLRHLYHPVPLFFYRVAFKACFLPQIFFTHYSLADKWTHFKAVLAMR